MIYADIIIDISHEKVDRSFQYLIPKELEKEIKIGMVVSIPFGNGNRVRKGYVVGLSEKAEIAADRIKRIEGICNDEETTESKLIALAAWMKENYGSTMIQALKTVLPIQEKMKAREKKCLVLNVSREEGEKAQKELEKGRGKARARLLAALLERKRILFSEAAEQLGTNLSVQKFLEEKGLIRVEYDEEYRIPIDEECMEFTGRQALSIEQETAVEVILKEWKTQDPRPVLLHGVTGSGKTQVYMELIEEVIAKGKQAIVLIPEIALTYQTVRRFYGRFGNKISVLNSKLSQGERYDQFKRAKRGEIQIMVGPRSALFTPFSDLGLIIIDEEHESTYKSENTPRYHARETAVQRAAMEGAYVVLGSATPSLESYYKAMDGRYGFVKLETRFEDRPLPMVSVVDLREELRAGNKSVLSRELQEAMEACLEKKEQIILFLNRRGYAGFVSCRSCGHVMKCPHCDVSLSEHRYPSGGSKLVCHYCGYETHTPAECPSCGSPYIGGFKAGTQQIEQAVKKQFPKAKILRMDYDTTRNKGSYEEILSAFSMHQADILIGTQMIVKGHDFPEVTLVGAIAADLSLNGSDYRSGERTFQLLTQAVGRSGRGKKQGRAIIQTYHPDHYSILAAVSQDYQSFYQEEISYREMMDYPPAAHMLGILASCEDEELLTKAMSYLKMFIQKVYSGKDLHMIGPAADSVSKIKDAYKQVIYLKHSNYRLLVFIKDHLEKYIEINSGFRKIYIQFDFT